MGRKRCAAWPVIIGAGLLPVAASAQTAGTAKVTGGKHIEEVTVTAQKRAQNVRKVPISISVLSSQQLKADHIQNFADLTRAVPNLSFSSGAGPGTSTLEIRGVASEAGTATVALYLDDVSLTTRNIYTEGTAEPRFLDISRVEVLRGPQGTLYGASALGGTLRYITNQPDLEKYGGSVFSELSGTYHGCVIWEEQGVANIPLIPGQLALRVAGETGGNSGYINNIDPTTGQTIKANINSEGFDDSRATLLWKPNDWLTVTPSIYWQEDIARDNDAQYTSLPNFQTPKVVAEPGTDRLFVPSVTVNADLGWASLISVTSAFRRTFDRVQDSTIYNNLAFYLCDPMDPVITCSDSNGNPVYNSPKGLYQALNNLPSSTLYKNNTRQFQQEIRLVSKPYDPEGVPFTWIAGLYYSQEYAQFRDIEKVYGASAAIDKYGLNLNDPTQIANAFPNSIAADYVFNGIQQYDTTQYAVFGDLTYYPIPALRLTVGSRYLFARDGEKSDQTLFYSYGLQGPTSAVGKFYAFTPRFTADFDITPEQTLYANASKGYRLGSENRIIAYIPAQAGAIGTPSYDLNQLGLHSSPTFYGPDKLWNFEVGDKFRFLGGRIVGSGDVYYILWDNIQQMIPLTTSGLNFETNAGNASIWGAEFELRGRATEQLTLGLNGGYTHATLDNGVFVGSTRLIGTYPGDIVPGVPRYSVDFNARQDFVFSDAITGFGYIDTPWVGRSRGVAIAGNSDYNRPSYATIDAVLGLDYSRWEFSLFGKNLTNNNKIIQHPSVQGSGVDIAGQSPIYGFSYRGGPLLPNTQGFTLRPLTVGVNATYKF